CGGAGRGHSGGNAVSLRVARSGDIPVAESRSPFSSRHSAVGKPPLLPLPFVIRRLAFFIGLVAAALHADTTPYPNPLILQRADPHLTLHPDGWYYFMGTVPEYDRLEVRRARSIPALATADATVIWRKHPTGPMGAHIWAPELHHIDGKW